MTRSCAERVALTNDASSVRASTETRTGPKRQRGARDAVRHPHGNGRRALIGVAGPDLAAMAHAALHDNGLAMQRMPRIVNGNVLSVVGRM